MTDRYEKFANSGVREINGYNAMIDAMDGKDTEKPPKMPQIVIIVDELADLMMVASKDVEEAICRLAQLARAAGIHLIIATQRPSVNVITGLIKANMPSRIAFAVTSGVDSRTILDMNGAEKLLGKGDMLFDPQGVPKPLRVQGAFVSDKEVSDIVKFIIEIMRMHSTVMMWHKRWRACRMIRQIQPLPFQMWKTRMMAGTLTLRRQRQLSQIRNGLQSECFKDTLKLASTGRPASWISSKRLV